MEKSSWWDGEESRAEGSWQHTKLAREAPGKGPLLQLNAVLPLHGNQLPPKHSIAMAALSAPGKAEEPAALSLSPSLFKSKR